MIEKYKKRLYKDKARKRKLFSFFRFLKERKIYPSFIRNVKNNYDNRSSLNFVYEHNLMRFFLQATPGEWINCSMIWNNTSEGFWFWKAINDEWNTYLDCNEI